MKKFRKIIKTFTIYDPLDIYDFPADTYLYAVF